MPQKSFFVLVSSLALFCSTDAAFGALKQSTTPAPGGFIQAGAGPSTCGCGPWPGDDWTTVYTGGLADLHELAFSGNSSASRSATYSSSEISASSSGSAAMGFVQMDASVSFPSTAAFSAGISNGGWNETFLISNPAHTGQAGFMQFTVTVVGRLDATGVTGAAAFTATAFKDNLQLMSNPLANPGNSDLLSTDRQYGNWGIATYGNPNADGKNVNDTVTFAVPFTFGTSFKLGVYVNCRAGQRSSGGFGTPNTSHATLSQFGWGGISNIYFNGAPVGGSTISSGTGIDWTQPIVGTPCAGDLNNDGFVEDSDFVIFLAAYNILDCADPSMPAGCPADFNNDNFVDDADFVIFVAAYNNLLCP
ncbi:MAG: hypothetical protein KF805_07970 [Phycisphaeraceae bacterium]|nr:hypothetical protein [Phycisphaeraceae bacterium]